MSGTDGGVQVDSGEPTGTDGGTAGTDGGTAGPFVPIAVMIGGAPGQRAVFALDLELTQALELSHEGAQVGTDEDGEFLVDVAPDGRHLVYVSFDPFAMSGGGDEVWVAPTDQSGGAVRVGEGSDVAAVRFAPDGSRVLYLLRDDDESWGPLMSASPDGSSAVMLADDVARFEWSPDSQHVLYATALDTGEPGGAFVVAPDGTGQVDLLAALDSLGVTGLGFNTERSYEMPVAFSPDGTRIAIVGARPAEGLGTGYEHNNVYLVDPDGSNPAQIAGPTDPADPLFDGRHVQWAPDGSRVAYYVAPQSGAPVLHTVRPDGTGDVTSDAGGFRLAGWSPDSRHVAMTAINFLRVAPADTLITTELAELESMYFASDVTEGARFAFSPDSASIAFQWDRDGQMELFAAAVDGTNVTKVSMPLEGDESVHSDFFWSEDSERLFYRAGRRAIEVERPSSVASEPVKAESHDDIDRVMRETAERLLKSCRSVELFFSVPVPRVSEARSDLTNCKLYAYGCEMGSGEGSVTALVCEEKATGLWSGFVSDDPTEVNAVLLIQL